MEACLTFICQNFNCSFKVFCSLSINRKVKQETPYLQVIVDCRDELHTGVDRCRYCSIHIVKSFTESGRATERCYINPYTGRYSFFGLAGV